MGFPVHALEREAETSQTLSQITVNRQAFLAVDSVPAATKRTLSKVSMVFASHLKPRFQVATFLLECDRSFAVCSPNTFWKKNILSNFESPDVNPGDDDGKTPLPACHSRHYCGAFTTRRKTAALSYPVCASHGSTLLARRETNKLHLVWEGERGYF